MTLRAWRPWVGAACLLLCVAVLRLVPVIVQPSLDWGDEVYQALEPAHRLVFGTGLVTWEFVAAIRSWLLPGAIAGILAAVRAAGGGPAIYLPAVALIFASLSLLPVIFTFRWCRAAFGVWPALAGAAVVGLAPELVYFGARTLAEVVAAHILVAALLLARRPAPAAGEKPCWRFSSGALLGLAVALRPQILPAAAVMFVWPGYGGRWRLAAGGAVTLTGAAVLDWVTLGAPGASIWRYAIVNLSGASTHFGVQPWFYFGLAEAAVWGVALPVPVALCLVGARRWALPAVAALAVLGVHMAIGHKEHRFIYPALVLASVSAGIGLADLSARFGGRWRGGVRGTALAGAAAWAGLSAAVWFGPGMTALRHRARDTLAAADYAAALPGLCGIGMGPGKDAWVPYGGYTHLGQDVPLYWPADQAAFGRERAGFNLLLSEARETDFQVLRCFGRVCAARRAGGCVKLPPDPMPARP